MHDPRAPAPSLTIALGGPHRASPPRYRLGIGHLLLWMTTTGAALTFLEAYFPYPGSPDRPTWNQRAARTRWLVNRLAAPAYGLALAGGGIALWNAVQRGSLFGHQPGHSLLVLLGSSSAGIPLPVAVDIWITERHWSEAAALFLFMAGLTGAALWSACRPKDRTTAWDFWQFSFAMISIAAGGLAFGSLVMGFADRHLSIAPFILFSITAAALGGTAALVAVVIDIVACEPRDLLHWAGVATLGLLAAHPVLLLLAQ